MCIERMSPSDGFLPFVSVIKRYCKPVSDFWTESCLHEVKPIANAAIAVKYFDKSTSKTKSFTVDGEYDFAVDIGSSINDTQRFEAISKASDMAVTDILSRVAVSSFK